MRCDPRPRLRPGWPEHDPAPAPVLGIELTQAVQHLPIAGEGLPERAGSVPLVAGIPLLARLYVDGGGLPAGIILAAAVVEVLDEDGATVATAASARVPPAGLADPRRSRVDSTLNLAVPGHACRGARTLRVTVEGDDAPGITADLVTWEVRVAFMPVPAVPLAVVALRLTSAVLPGFPLPAPPDAEHPGLIEGARRYLPVPAMPVLATSRPPDVPIRDLSLREVYLYLVGMGNLTTAPSVTLGLIGDWRARNPGALGRGGAGVAVVSTDTPEIGAHELGHVLGRLHSPCGRQAGEDPDYPVYRGRARGATGEWGLRLVPGPRNTTVFEALDPDHLDYMGDGSCAPAWTSPYGWRRVLAGARHCVWRHRRGRGLWMIADIAVTGADEAELGPSPVVDTAPPRTLGPPTEFEAELVAAGGGTLRRVRLHELDVPGAPPGGGLPLRVLEAIPWHPAAVALRVRRRGRLVRLIPFAEDPPPLDVLEADVAASGLARLAWGPPAEDVTYVIRYSPDDGATWFGLATGLRQDAVELDLAGLPAGPRCRLEVTATRGGRSTTRVSAALPREPAPLVAHITHPTRAEEPALVGDGMIELAGWAGSPDLPELPGAALRWVLTTGSGDRVELGRGSRVLIPTTVLGEGAGRITMVAEGDVLGVPSASDEVRVARAPSGGGSPLP